MIRISRGWNFAPVLSLYWGQDPNLMASLPIRVWCSSLSFVRVRMLQIVRFGLRKEKDVPQKQHNSTVPPEHIHG